MVFYGALLTIFAALVAPVVALLAFLVPEGAGAVWASGMGFVRPVLPRALRPVPWRCREGDGVFPHADCGHHAGGVALGCSAGDVARAAARGFGGVAGVVVVYASWAGSSARSIAAAS